MRVQFNAPVILPGQPPDLLGNAEFGAVLPVQERRNDSEAQVSPASEPFQPERLDGRREHLQTMENTIEDVAKPSSTLIYMIAG